jgi:hypothetical protein
VELSVDSSDAGTRNEPPGGLVVGQVFHEGGWNPFPRTWPNLARALAEKTGASSRIGARRVVPGKDDLFEFPLIYMTGYSPFRMVEDQLRAFRRYLEQGGLLIADPACGSRDFDKAFRDFVKELYPDGALVRLKLDHPVFRSAYRITKVEYKSPVLAESPGLDEPVLEALMLDGRPAIIYSPYNLGGELGGEGSALSRGYKHDDAFRVAMNIIVYAATQ